MRKWLLKLLAGNRVVMINADLWSGDRALGTDPDLRILLGAEQKMITINAHLNSGSLHRVAVRINRTRNKTGS